MASSISFIAYEVVSVSLSNSGGEHFFISMLKLIRGILKWDEMTEMLLLMLEPLPEMADMAQNLTNWLLPLLMA